MELLHDYNNKCNQFNHICYKPDILCSYKPYKVDFIIFAIWAHLLSFEEI